MSEVLLWAGRGGRGGEGGGVFMRFFCFSHFVIHFTCIGVGNELIVTQDCVL